MQQLEIWCKLLKKKMIQQRLPVTDDNVIINQKPLLVKWNVTVIY